MNKRLLFLYFLGAAAVAVTTYMTGCAAIFDKIADTVLANEVRFDDRESPRTAHAIAASADGVQLLGGQGNGLSCSLPPGAQALAFTRTDKQAPIALQMRQACAFHDYCYRHGNATYGYSQADCDFMLQQQAFRLCKFIDKKATIGECETNARKVTIGVRLGGFGNFKRGRALEDEKASTFMEFDPYPVRASTQRVVRIADTPWRWVRDGLLPKAAYHFDIRPSGSLVHILGWKPVGGMVCSSFELPASYNALNGAPMVVRDATGGEDWFVWWKRSELSSTGGHFALLPPGRATRQDWVEVAGGVVPHTEAGQCESKALWASDGAAPGAPPLAFVTESVDLKLSELHPVNGANTPGLVRLMGLTTHSCHEVDRSLCLRDVVFDTARRKFRKDPASPTPYRAVDPNCIKTLSKEEPLDDCDRYRNYVGAPYVVAHESSPSLIWMRRGTGNGDGYETNATVRRYTIGKTRADPGTDLGEMYLTAFPEAMEPAFITSAASASPTFVSLVQGEDGFKILTQTAVPKGGESAAAELACFSNADPSWLRRPPALLQDRKDASRSYIVFSRVRLNDVDKKAFEPNAVLEVAVATLANGMCTGVQETSFPEFFKSLVAEEKCAATAAAAAKKPSYEQDAEARERFGRFAERVRGGQMVLADLTGDGVPDIVQVTKMPGTLRFLTAVLVGNIEVTGLRFRELVPDSSGEKGLVAGRLCPAARP